MNIIAIWIVFVLFGVHSGCSAPLTNETNKHPALCASVIQHSGYIKVAPESHYFYWFFESQTDPANAPLTVWLNGGPGCSSMVGLWREHIGPCKLSDDGQEATFNPYSWNKYSNMLFFDQPAGTGFSFGEDDVNRSEKGAIPAYSFITGFLKQHPKYATLPLHFFGESYAGRYIPVYADYILQQNQRVKSGLLDNPIIHLVSIGIGNGWTSPLIQMGQYATMACNSSYGSIVSEQICQRMSDNLPTCLQKVTKCYDTDKDGDCYEADLYCNTNVISLFGQANRSYYDVRTNSNMPSDYADFLNKPSIKMQIGAIGSYQQCSEKVFDRFFFTGDSIRNTDIHVARLLNNGVNVLIYAGDADYICSWYGNYAWMNKLEYIGQQDYRSQSLVPWIVDGIEVGQIQSGGNLTFIRIYEAGHEVPYYQPKAALYMFNHHIKNIISLV